MAKPTTIPEWNTDGSNRTTPSSGQQASGWTIGQAVPSSWLNWLAYHTYTWAKWCRDEALTAADIAAAAWEWTEYHLFRRPVAIYGYGPVAALLVVPEGSNTAIQTTGRIEAFMIEASSTISTAANLVVGTAVSARTVNATMGMSCHGLTSLAGVSELSNSSDTESTLTLKNSAGFGLSGYALEVTTGKMATRRLEVGNGLSVTGAVEMSGTDTGTATPVTANTPIGISGFIAGQPTCGVNNSLVTTASHIMLTPYAGAAGVTVVVVANGHFIVERPDTTLESRFAWEVKAMI